MTINHFLMKFLHDSIFRTLDLAWKFHYGLLIEILSGNRHQIQTQDTKFSGQNLNI